MDYHYFCQLLIYFTTQITEKGNTLITLTISHSRMLINPLLTVIYYFLWVFSAKQIIHNKQPSSHWKGKHLFSLPVCPFSGKLDETSQL